MTTMLMMRQAVSLGSLPMAPLVGAAAGALGVLALGSSGAEEHYAAGDAVGMSFDPTGLDPGLRDAVSRVLDVTNWMACVPIYMIVDWLDGQLRVGSVGKVHCKVVSDLADRQWAAASAAVDAMQVSSDMQEQLRRYLYAAQQVVKAITDRLCANDYYVDKTELRDQLRTLAGAYCKAPVGDRYNFGYNGQFGLSGLNTGPAVAGEGPRVPGIAKILLALVKKGPTAQGYDDADPKLAATVNAIDQAAQAILRASKAGTLAQLTLTSAQVKQGQAGGMLYTMEATSFATAAKAGARSWTVSLARDSMGRAAGQATVNEVGSGSGTGVTGAPHGSGSGTGVTGAPHGSGSGSGTGTVATFVRKLQRGYVTGPADGFTDVSGSALDAQRAAVVHEAAVAVASKAKAGAGTQVVVVSLRSKPSAAVRGATVYDVRAEVGPGRGVYRAYVRRDAKGQPMPALPTDVTFLGAASPHTTAVTTSAPAKHTVTTSSGGHATSAPGSSTTTKAWTPADASSPQARAAVDRARQAVAHKFGAKAGKAAVAAVHARRTGTGGSALEFRVRLGAHVATVTGAHATVVA